MAEKPAQTTQPTEPKPDTWGQWFKKQLIGSGIATVIGAAGGVVYSLVKKTPMVKTVKSGAALGAVSSIGLGNMVYDAIIPADKTPEPEPEKKFTAIEDAKRAEKAQEKSAGQSASR